MTRSLCALRPVCRDGMAGGPEPRLYLGNFETIEAVKSTNIRKLYSVYVVECYCLVSPLLLPQCYSGNGRNSFLNFPGGTVHGCG